MLRLSLLALAAASTLAFAVAGRAAAAPPSCTVFGHVDTPTGYVQAGASCDRTIVGARLVFPKSRLLAGGWQSTATRTRHACTVKGRGLECGGLALARNVDFVVEGRPARAAATGDCLAVTLVAADGSKLSRTLQLSELETSDNG